MNAVEQAYFEHRAMLVSVIARRIGSTQGAEDIAQDAFVRLLESQRINDIRRFDAYLRVVASHLLWQSAKDRARAAVVFDSALADVVIDRAVDAMSDPLCDQLNMDQQLIAVLSEVPALQAACVVLRKRDGLSDRQIARTLGVAPNTVRKYVTLGLARCRSLADIDRRAANCSLLRKQAG